jgi:hypothetical protein
MNLGQAKNLLKNPDFMKWFRKSPVKDESGVPSRVFHGSGTSFDEFKTNDITKAMFFADMPSMANSFNKGTGKGFTEKLKNGHVIWAKEGSQTYPVYLSMQNPKIIDVEKIKNFHNTDFAKEKIISQAKKDGHDGVIFQNIRDYGDYRFGEGISGNVYAVFNPTQIKSQFNKGTFDPTNPNILKTATAIATGATAMLSKDALAAKHKQMAEKQALQDAYSPVDMVIAGATGGATMGLRAISALADPVINYAIDRMLGD